MSKNCARSIFPLACLPTDVLYIVSGYLSPKDKGRFARISKYFRRFFESSHLWQNVTICVKSTELKTSVFILKMIQKRKIKSIEFAVFDVKLFRIISTILPQLESLSLQKTSSSKGEMANALKSFSVCTQLRSLTIRDTTGRSSSLESMFAVRKFLTSLFELEYITLMEINLLESSERAKAELQAALTSSGRLTSVSLTNCEWVSMALVNSILTHNGHLHTLKLNNTHIAYEGNRKVKKSPQKGPDVNTKGDELKLQILDLSGISGIQGSQLLQHWMANILGKSPNLKTLSLAQNKEDEILNKIQQLHTLERLDLSSSCVRSTTIQFWNLPCLKQLELKGCHKLDGRCVHLLSSLVGRTLEHLGLANCGRLLPSDILNVPIDFSKLRLLDFSGNAVFCNDILQLWYNDKKFEKCKLKNLVLKGCSVTKDIVRAICKKLGNRVVIEI